MSLVWNFLLGTYESMRAIYLDVIEAMGLEITVFGENYTITELVFGAGLVVLMAFMITKFLL